MSSKRRKNPLPTEFLSQRQRDFRFADEKEPLRATINGENCRGETIDGYDLSHTRFINCDFSDASFKRCELKKCYFQDCILKNTTFEECDLENSAILVASNAIRSELLPILTFKNTNLRGVSFVYPFFSPQRWVWDVVNIEGAIFFGISGFNFVREIEKTREQNSGINDRIFGNPRLSLNEVRIVGEDLSNSKIFEYGNLESAKIARSNLSNSSFREASMALARIDDCDCRRADFSGVGMFLGKIRNSDFRGADFRGADLRQVTFENVKVSGALYDSKTQGLKYAQKRSMNFQES